MKNLGVDFLFPNPLPRIGRVAWKMQPARDSSATVSIFTWNRLLPARRYFPRDANGDLMQFVCRPAVSPRSAGFPTALPTRLPRRVHTCTRRLPRTRVHDPRTNGNGKAHAFPFQFSGVTGREISEIMTRTLRRAAGKWKRSFWILWDLRGACGLNQSGAKGILSVLFSTVCSSGVVLFVIYIGLLFYSILLCACIDIREYSIFLIIIDLIVSTFDACLNYC